MKKPRSCIVLTAILAVAMVGCAREKEIQIWHPLVMKYLFGQESRASIVQVGTDVYAEFWTKEPPERRLLAWQQYQWKPGVYYAWTDEYTTLSGILNGNGIVVSNTITANDMANLVDVVMPVNVFHEYLVESILHSQAVWIVESRYHGGPDDAHRRPSKIITRIYTDSSGLLTNIVREFHPRPMDMKSQNQQIQPIAGKPGSG